MYNNIYFKHKHASCGGQRDNNNDSEKLIQEDTLTGNESSVDIATKENLENLVKIGERLLKKPIARVNLETGVCEPSDWGTNEKALKRYYTSF